MPVPVGGTGESPACSLRGSPRGYEGIAALPDGRLVCTPSSASSIMLYDPDSDTVEEVGDFEGRCKWSGCAVLPDGRVVFAPFDATSVLIFEPNGKTFEHVGDFEGHCKWSGCAVLHDGRVIFAPYGAASILIYDPNRRTFEHVGDFDGHCRWRGCTVLPDGRAVFAPNGADSVLIYNPSRKTVEHVGDFPGSCKWDGCAVLPDGRAVFAPSKAASALILDPIAKTFDHVGDFKGSFKWDGCAVLPDGHVVFAPCCASFMLIVDPGDKTWEKVELGDLCKDPGWSGCTALPDGRVFCAPESVDGLLVAQHTSWHAEARPQRREEPAWSIARHMWRGRAFADAAIEAGLGESPRRRIPVHRAVLASRSEVFERMFSGAFREAGAAEVSLPEDPDVVEAMVEYIYTGELPSEADPLAVLPLAHLFGLRDCVAACAMAVDHCDAGRAVQVLAPLLESPAVAAAWARLKPRIRNDPKLFESVLLELATGAWPKPQPAPEMVSVSTQAEEDGLPAEPESDAGGGDGGDEGDAGAGGHGRPGDGSGGCQEDGDGLDEDEAGGAPECPERVAPGGASPAAGPAGGGEAMDVGTSVGEQGSGSCTFLCFDKISDAFVDALEHSELGQELVRCGSHPRPPWARGATILVPGLWPAAMEQSGLALGDLRPWHVVIRTEDVPWLRTFLLDAFARPQRPRERTLKKRHFVLTVPVPFIPRWHGATAPPHSIGLDETDSEETLSAGDASDVGSIAGDHGEAPVGVHFEEPAFIDEDTAVLIQHEQWASAIEARLSKTQTGGGLESLVPIHNTFIHYPVPGAASPRTVCTA